MVLIGLDGGSACSVEDGAVRAFFEGSELRLIVRRTSSKDDDASGLRKSSSRDSESTASANSEERLLLSESSAESSSIVWVGFRYDCRSSSLYFSAKRLLALAARVGLICLLLKIDGSRSFSDDKSLLVVVSLLARCLIASTAPMDPARSRPSLDFRDGEVINTSTSSLVFELRSGEEPDLSLRGIFANLIC